MIIVKKSLSRAVALAGLLGAAASQAGVLFPVEDRRYAVIADPFKPRRKSKGEKHRNRQYRK